MIIQGSATALPIADESVHCVISSPPYNVSIQYGGGVDDYLSWSDYEDLVFASAREMYRVLIEHGRVWINVQPAVPAIKGQNQYRMPLSGIWLDALTDAGFVFRDQIVWVQDSFDGGCAWGSWLTPSGPNMRGSHEIIWAFSKGDWKRPTPPEWKGWKDERENLGGDWTDLCRNVWTMRPVSRKMGPACFPVELPARCIRLSSWPGETILDPFVGTGTTIQAARELGRVGIGVDLSTVQLGLSKPEST